MGAGSGSRGLGLSSVGNGSGPKATESCDSFAFRKGTRSAAPRSVQGAGGARLRASWTPRTAHQEPREAGTPVAAGRAGKVGVQEGAPCYDSKRSGPALLATRHRE